MLSIAERHQFILDKLHKFGFIRIAEVADELGVTTVTIRNDVKILEEKGLLYKVHGSARLANPHIADRDLVTKSSLNREAKRRIAERAVMLIGENDSIMISAGSTTYALAEAIHDREQHGTLNVVTPFLKVSALLNECNNIIVEQLGVNKEQVTPEASFIDDLGADSLDSVELIMAFEEEFGAAIPEEDAEKLTTVGKVVEYLKSKGYGDDAAK